jgi:hypothetical protein
MNSEDPYIPIVACPVDKIPIVRGGIEMSRTRATSFSGFALLVLLAFPAGAQMGHDGHHQPGQHPGQGMPMDHMQQMQDMMQRMSGVMHHAHELSQGMQQQMHQHEGQMMEQHQMMQRMDECVGNMAEHMHASMEQQRRMMDQPHFSHDPEMQQDMQRLQDHMGTMTKHMEQTLQVIERMQKRLQQPKPQQ